MGSDQEFHFGSKCLLDMDKTVVNMSLEPRGEVWGGDINLGIITM